MNAGKQTDPNRLVAAARSDKKVTRQFKGFPTHFESTERFGNQIDRGFGKLIQRRQQIGNRSLGANTGCDFVGCELSNGVHGYFPG